MHREIPEQGLLCKATCPRSVATFRQMDLERIWHTDDVETYMNTPVLKDNYLFGMSSKHKGQYFCLDARSGASMWISEGRKGENAAIVSAGSFLFLLGNDAELTVAPANEKRYEVAKKYSVAQSPTWAHPVVLRDQILIKDESTLALWRIR